MKPEWHDNKGNFVLDGDGFWLSYNPDPSEFIKADGSETAIVVPDVTKMSGRRFFILMGDHREAMENMSLEEAMKFWRDCPDLHSIFTDHEIDGLTAGQAEAVLEAIIRTVSH